MKTLDAIFAASVAAHGDRTAIEVPAGRGRPAVRVTYAELDARATGASLAIDAVAGPSPRCSGAGQQIVVCVLPRDGIEVYAAQLGIVRSGRAWCCLDPSHPDGHLASAIANVSPVLIITDQRHGARLRALAGAIPVLEAQAIEPRDGAVTVAGSEPDGLAYLISTSGTTGAPKGVLVRHASIAALVEADRARLGLGPGDRVAQCSSNAYDSSIEETWLALAVGATLVPVDDEVVRSGPDLPAWLREQAITVFCPPPTLLRAMGVEDPARELPALRFVYVGGEPLPQDLSDLWSATLWLENGYGPTECTVTCTRGRMQPGVPVHLGDAVPGSRAIIVRDDGTETNDGEEGELWMSGMCLAEGYLGQPALTAQRFVTHPRHGRVYRTGDLVRRSRGAIEYLGRIDAQVKVRGHRVELGAVEACLVRVLGVREAACALVGEGSGARLGAVVVGEAIDMDAVLAHARLQLPPAMLPSFLCKAASLPRMVSGKIDRRAVADMLAQGSVDASRWDDHARDPSRSIAERVAACAAAAVAARELPSGRHHFFEDLGGDSLRAVDLVLRIRRSIGLEATVRMVYDDPTMAGLARRVQGAVAARRAEPPMAAIAPMRRKLVAWLVQAGSLGLGVVLASTVVSWLAFRGAPSAIESIGVLGAALMAPVAWGLTRLMWFPASIACTVIIKRVLIGRYQPGWVPVWSSRHVREWMVEQVGSTIPWSIVDGTAATSWGLRRLGARVGNRVHLHRGVNVLRSGWDLLELGDGVTLCQDAAVLVSRIDRGGIEHGRICIGEGATIGVRATVEPGVSIGAGADLAPLATVRAGASVPAGARWDGVPGGVAGSASSNPHEVRDDLGPVGHAAVSCAARMLVYVGMGAIAALSCIVVDRALGGALAAWLRSPSGSWSLLAAACGAVVLAVPLWLLAAALALRCTGTIMPGTYAIFSVTALRIWWRTGMVESAGRWISGTLFWPMWLRLAGMRIGRDTELSSIIDVLPETVSIGKGCFFADGIYFASPEWSRGVVTVAHTGLGDETFVGNHAVVPAGRAYPDRLFIGVSTVAPSGSHDGDGWFGIPPMRLTRREVVSVDRRLTHEPGVLQRINRWSWESARCLAVVPAIVGVAIWLGLAAQGDGTMASMAWWGTLAAVAAWAWLVAFGITAKWILLGRVQPGQHGLWSCWCSRWDYLYVLWWFSARVALGRVDGTPVLAWCLRAAGTRIGRDVMLGPGATQIVDPDMLSYGDRSAVACHPQAHTFEDRVLKIDHVRIEHDASAGENAVTFYGSVIEHDARLEPGSVLMKGGVVAAGTVACGAPVG
ncbi:MAG: amino acid adenylation domain-containing protein [Planctomycetes bacterium]|nr:amino acid adenylation domain-containing protein [Planctomycetota bacterium]